MQKLKAIATKFVGGIVDTVVKLTTAIASAILAVIVMVLFIGMIYVMSNTQCYVDTNNRVNCHFEDSRSIKLPE